MSTSKIVEEGRGSCEALKYLHYQHCHSVISLLGYVILTTEGIADISQYLCNTYDTNQHKVIGLDYLHRHYVIL